MSVNKIVNKKISKACFRCKSKKIIEELDFLTQATCKTCYIEMIEKRIRKFIRINKVFSPNNRICILDDDSIAFFVSKQVILNLSKKMPLKIFYEKVQCNSSEKGSIKKSKCINKTNNQKKFRISFFSKIKYDKIIIPTCGDDEIDLFIDNLFFGNIVKYLKSLLKYSSSKKTFLLNHLTKKECYYYAKYSGLIKNKSLTSHYLDSFEKPYPETKHAMLKSIKELKEIIT
jgi:hypothetical protein